MRQSTRCRQRLCELIDTDLPADELERLAQVDALLRVAAVRDREYSARLRYRRSTNGRPRGANCLPQAKRRSRDRERRKTEEPTHALKLTFGELALVYKSLQAVKTLGALPPQDELLNDTIQLVDQALSRAV